MSIIWAMYRSSLRCFLLISQIVSNGFISNVLYLYPQKIPSLSPTPSGATVPPRSEFLKNLRVLMPCPCILSQFRGLVPYRRTYPQHYPWLISSTQKQNLLKPYSLVFPFSITYSGIWPPPPPQSLPLIMFPPGFCYCLS